MNDKTSERQIVETAKIKPQKLIEILKIKSRKYYKLALKIVLIVGLPLAIAVVTIYYFFVFLSPKEILARSIKNLEDVKSSKYSTEIAVNFTNNDYETSREIGPESNILKIIQPASYKATGEGVINIANGLEGDSNFRISSNGNDITKLYLKNRKDEYFLKLSDFSYSNYVDKSLLETWIRIDSKFLQDKFAIGLFSDSGDGDVRKEALSIIREAPPIELIERFPSDKVKGMDAYHYKFRVNSENLVKDFNLGENSAISKITFKDGDIWIGKKKNSLFRISVAGEIEGVGAEGTTLELDFDITFYEINYENMLNFPDNFIDIGKLLQ